MPRPVGIGHRPMRWQSCSGRRDEADGSVEALTALADERLCAAKRAGRNQVPIPALTRRGGGFPRTAAHGIACAVVAAGVPAQRRRSTVLAEARWLATRLPGRRRVVALPHPVYGTIRTVLLPAVLDTPVAAA